jgi:hypothetical protein
MDDHTKINIFGAVVLKSVGWRLSWRLFFYNWSILLVMTVGKLFSLNNQ